MIYTIYVELLCYAPRMEPNKCPSYLQLGHLLLLLFIQTEVHFGIIKFAHYSRKRLKKNLLINADNLNARQILLLQEKF
jgi:hypothetical protein